MNYGKGMLDFVKVVFDCMPSESPTFGHFISMLAAKTGMDATVPQIKQQRTETDLSYAIELRYSEQLFSQPPRYLDEILRSTSHMSLGVIVLRRFICLRSILAMMTYPNHCDNWELLKCLFAIVIWCS